MVHILYQGGHVSQRTQQMIKELTLINLDGTRIHLSSLRIALRCQGVKSKACHQIVPELKVAVDVTNFWELFAS
jgi:hypothetical protein